MNACSWVSRQLLKPSFWNVETFCSNYFDRYSHIFTSLMYPWNPLFTLTVALLFSRSAEACFPDNRSFDASCYRLPGARVVFRPFCELSTSTLIATKSYHRAPLAVFSHAILITSYTANISIMFRITQACINR